MLSIAVLRRPQGDGYSAPGAMIVFFERDVPYSAAHRDLHELPGGNLILYSEGSPLELPAVRRQ